MGNTKGYLAGDLKVQLVGAKDFNPDPANSYPYHGPCARVSFDDTWLHIVTDDYEGHAMLNIEALPYLRKALAKIAKARRAEPPAHDPAKGE